MFNRFLLLLAVFIGKTAIVLSRKIGAGGGSSAPGRLALRICPSLIRRLSGSFKNGVIAVTATNGKTTTTRMIAAGLQAAGKTVVYNISGANMAGGIATCLIEASSPGGKIRAEWGLFEIDEGSFPQVLPRLAPRAVLVGNFFRDQLDRYGEVSILVNRIRETLHSLNPAPELILNADDPMAASLAGGYTAQIRYFGLDDPDYGFSGLQADADIRHCPACRTPLVYSVAYVGHLGSYTCSGCGADRPQTEYTASAISLNGIAGQQFSIHNEASSEVFRLNIPGEHIVYNLLSAVSVLHAVCGIDLKTLPAVYKNFKAPYGRFESFTINERTVYLVLVKNPAGANVILRLIERLRFTGPFLFLLNDLSADGRDISWIYDAQFEAVRHLEAAVVSGRRACDMRLRLVLAGCSEEALQLCTNTEEALDMALKLSTAAKPLFIIATYTAMHEVRRAIAEKTDVLDFWKEQ